jgi:hypothetical protein
MIGHHARPARRAQRSLCWPSPHERVLILLSMLGAKRQVSLAAAAIEAVG